jgi:hypothetical protein
MHLMHIYNENVVLQERVMERRAGGNAVHVKQMVALRCVCMCIYVCLFVLFYKSM